MLTGESQAVEKHTGALAERCKEAGIEVAIVTGDHPLTALAIAREVGIADSPREVVTGCQLAEIGHSDVPEFLERVKTMHVFARVSPVQKFRIADALIKVGHFVAVTGDGVNGAPALRRFNTGVAMGSGMDVTKETASIMHFGATSDMTLPDVPLQGLNFVRSIFALLFQKTRRA